MDWIIENISKGIWKFFADIVTDMINAAFGLIVETIINTTDINKYINVNSYLVWVQIIAGSLLTLSIVWQVFKQQSNGVFSGSEKSLSVLTLKTVFAGFFIYFLPWSVINVLIPINNALIGLIQSLGITITADKFDKFAILPVNLTNLGALMIIMSLVLAIGFLILAIAGGIRYIELFLCILFAPIAAISITADGDGVQVWIRETICIVFTQAIHILLIQVLLNIMAQTSGIMMVILSVGAIAVMLKGPQVLRTFLYSSGVGSAGVSAVGSAGRMAAMKYMFKSPVN